MESNKLTLLNNSFLLGFLGSILVLQKLADAYQTYLKELAVSCGLPSAEFEIPLRVNMINNAKFDVS